MGVKLIDIFRHVIERALDDLHSFFLCVLSQFSFIR
jgi:hypothetical protein